METKEKISARGGLRSAGSRGHQSSFAQEVIHAAPADGLAPETGQPDYEGHSVPHWNERHFFPETGLFHAPGSDQRHYRNSSREIPSQIRKRNGGGRNRRNSDQRPRQPPCEEQAE